MESLSSDEDELGGLRGIESIVSRRMAQSADEQSYSLYEPTNDLMESYQVAAYQLASADNGYLIDALALSQSQARESSSEEEVEDASSPLTDQHFAEMIRQLIAQTGGGQRLVSMIEHSQDSAAADLKEALQRIHFRISSASPGKRTASGVSHDWEGRMDAARRVFDKAQSARLLYEITRDFMNTARLYGAVIIAERSLPAWEKSIKPANLGGIAGGEKFVVGGILFKFSSDVAISSTQFLYGGAKRDDDAAHKAAGHERKGIEILGRKCTSNAIKVPLMTLVDYRGCRLSAQSLLPLSGLFYGSCDAGKTIAAGDSSSHDAHLLAQVRKLGSDLNLAEHKVRELSTGVIKELCFPVDIEIQRSSRDPDTLYIIDTARLMPPMRPLGPSQSREIFYKLFRPEFVQSFEKPLSPDAFAAFGEADISHHATILEAQTLLFDTVIPEVGAKMTAIDSKTAGRYCQQRGVNIRFLGRVRSHSTVPEVRSDLLKEMLARVIYKRINHQWRKEHVGTDVLPLIKVTLTMLNEIIDPDSIPNCSVAKMESLYRDAIVQKFGSVAVSDSELLPLRDSLARVCELGGIAVDTVILQSCEKLTVSDINLEAKVKELSFSAISEAESKYREAKVRSSPQRAVQSLQQGISILRRELVSDPRNLTSKCRLARMLLEIVKQIHTIADNANFCVAHDQFLEDLEALPSSGEHYLSESIYYRAKLHCLYCARELSLLNVKEAASHWKKAVVLVEKLSSKENWLLCDDSMTSAKKIDRIRARLFSKLFLQMSESINGPDDYNDIVVRASGLPQSEAFFQTVENMNMDDWRCPKFIPLAMYLGVVAVKTFFARQSVIDVSDLTHAPVDGAFLELLGRFSLPSIDHLKFVNVIAPDLSPLENAFQRITSLTVKSCQFVSMSHLIACLDQCTELKELRLDELAHLDGNSLFQHLPATLQSLEMRGNPCLTAPLEDWQLPALLERIKIIASPDFVVSKSLVSLPKLLSLHVDNLESTVVIDALSSSLESLVLRNGNLTGEELTRVMPLVTTLKLGSNLSSAGLANVAKKFPNLQDFCVRRNDKMTSDDFFEAFSQFSQLQRLDCAYCGALNNHGVVDAMQKSSARLIALDSEGTYPLTSDGVARVIDYERLETLCFFSPRDPLLLPMSQCRQLTRLMLGRCAVISPEGWDAISVAAPTLINIKLLDLGNISDSILSRILCATVRLEKLVLENLPLTGIGLAEAATNLRLMSLKKLTLKSTCGDEAALIRTLELAPALRELLVDVSGESDNMLRALAFHCRKLRKLVIQSAAKANTLTDPEGWISKIASLRSLEIVRLFELQTRTLERIGGQLGQLHSMSLYSMFRLTDLHVQAVAKLANLTHLGIFHSFISAPQLEFLSNQSFPLVSLSMSLDQEELVDLTASILRFKALKYLDVTKSLELLFLDPKYGVHHHPVSASLHGRKALERSELEQDWVISPLAHNRGRFDAILSNMPALSSRTKFAYFTWMYDEYSVRLAFSLAMRGYQCIIGKLVGSDFKTRIPVNVHGFSDLLFEYFTGPKGFHSVSVSEDLFARRIVEREILEITPRLDAVFTFYPYAVFGKGRAMAWNRLSIQNCLPDNLREYFDYMREQIFFPQVVTILGLMKILKQSPGFKMAIYCNALASISDANTSSMHSMRSSSAAVASFIKTMSMEFQDSIVAGLHPGLWFPMMRSELPGGLNAQDASTRTLAIFDRLQKHDSGHIVRHNLDHVPP